MNKLAPDPLSLHRFASVSELDAALAAFTARQLTAALDRRGRAALVVSGGRTPVGFFEALRDMPLDWHRVTITLADERWVPESDGDSNARLVRAHLMQGAASAARFIPLWHAGSTPAECASRASAALATLDHPFDVVLLGMGEDGHTASLFPGSIELPAALHDASGRACMAVTGHKPPPQRLTLTAPRLLHAHHLVLHITGETKWRVLGQALQPGPVESMPVRAFLNAPHPSRHVFWSC